MVVEVEMEGIRSLLTEKLNQQLADDHSIIGLDYQYQDLYEILQGTLETGTSNSVLLLGGQSTGKSLTLMKVFSDLYDSSRGEGVEEDDSVPPFIPIQLNGLIHTDDKVALLEICRQLSISSSSILNETSESTNEFKVINYNESLNLVLKTLNQGDRENIPLFFVLDEFDQFAGQGRRQGLLYNLFDICQNASNPITVIGISRRMDCLDSLEKRVKSRFSHRIIHFHGASSFEGFCQIAQQALLVPEQLLPAGSSSSSSRKASKRKHEQLAASFNEHVREVVMKNTGVIRILRRIYDLNRDIRLFYRICYYPISQLNDDKSQLDPTDFYLSSLDQLVDCKSSSLQSVSLLQLCLIIAMKRLGEKDIIPCNFEMIYSEYKSFALKHSSNLETSNNNSSGSGNGNGSGSMLILECHSKAVAFKAFEHLIESELVEYTSADNYNGAAKEFRMVRLLLHPQLIMEAVMKFRDLPSAVQKWSMPLVNQVSTLG